MFKVLDALWVKQQTIFVSYWLASFAENMVVIFVIHHTIKIKEDNLHYRQYLLINF